MNNFDQWIEALSKQIPIQSDENEIKGLSKVYDTYSSDDFDEEE